MIPSDPPQFTTEQIAAGWVRVFSQAAPKASMFPMPFEAHWPELPKAEREWAIEIGTENGVPYFGLADTWGNHARVLLDPSLRAHSEMAKMIAAYLAAHGEDVPA